MSDSELTTQHSEDELDMLQDANDPNNVIDVDSEHDSLDDDVDRELATGSVTIRSKSMSSGCKML
jgi:hypothetical protein